MTIRFGYQLVSEEHGPKALVRNAMRAEAVGFEFAAISDLFSPWLEEQGHSPFAWSVLGAISHATRSIGLMTAVTCPIMRYHPAIIAQAASTVALLSTNRFTLGLGTGDHLNEHIVGERWPDIVERRARLSEAVDIIKGLLTGGLQHHRGQYFKLDHARLFDRPERPPGLAIAAGGKLAARLAGRKGVALITTEPSSELVDAYRSAGGTGPLYAEVPMCYAASEAAAKRTAHRYFRWSMTGGGMTEVPYTEHFATASRFVSAEALAERVSCGPSLQRHARAIERYLQAGYDHLILLQIGQEQDAFFKFFEHRLAPHFRTAQSKYAG